MTADQEKYSADGLRALRAVDLLEEIGTEEPRRILQHLATGVSEAPLTRAAKAALLRQQR